jgi:hypothetical protein
MGLTTAQVSPPYCYSPPIRTRYSPQHKDIRHQLKPYSYISVFLFSDIKRKTKYRLCGLVVRVTDYRYRDPGFDYRRYQIICNGVHSAS